MNVSVTGDLKKEPDETLTVSLSGQSPGSVTLARASATGTIVNDDAEPVVQFSAATSSVSEAGTGLLGNTAPTLAITVTLDRTSSSTVTVPVTYGGSAINPDDYTSDTTALTFAPGVTSQTITLTIALDTLDEDDETVILSLGTPVGATLGTQVTHTATILDDDPKPTLSWDTADTASGSVAENASAPGYVTLKLSTASGRPVPVSYSIASGATATLGTDYTLPAGQGPGDTITFAPGETSKKILVTPVDDSLDEIDETFTVNLSAGPNATAASPTSQTFTINDNDAPPTVGFTVTSASGLENVTTVQVGVDLSAVSGRTVTVPFTVNPTPAQGSDATQDCGATPTGDFCVTTSTPLTFAPGETHKNITIAVNNDSANEPDENVRLALGTPTGATVGANATYVYTIKNDDAVPQASFTTSAQSVSEGAGTATVTVQLSRPADQDVTISYSLSGTALNGTDYTVSPASPIVIAQGESTKVLTVTITNDSSVENDETVVLTLSNPFNATLTSPTSHTLTITNDDTAGVRITQSGGSTNVVEGATDGTQSDTYTVALTSQPAQDVTVSLASSGGHVTVTSPLTFTPANWSTPQTVTVTAVNDSIQEGPYSDTVTHTVSSGDANYDGLAVPDVSVAIQDDDKAGVLIQQTGGGTTVTEGGATDTYALQLTAQPLSDVTVTLTPASQVTVSATTLTVTSANWNTPQSVTVSAVDDAVAEGTHTGSVAHATSSADANFNGLAVPSLTVQIQDNDSAGVVLSKTSASATEGGAGDSYNVHLASQPVGDVTVTITPDSQVSVNPAQIVFNSVNWNMDVAVAVSAVDDAVDEPSPQSATITHSVSATSSDPAYAGLAGPSVSVSVTDNDAPPGVTLGITGSPLAENGGVATVTATLDAVSGQDVTVNLAFSGTASNGADYTRSATSITIPAGSTTGSITLTGVDDALDEADETIVVDIATVTNGTETGTQQVTATITDDDSPPNVTLSLAGDPLPENGGTATVTATLDAVSGQDVTVNLAYSGTATFGTDYTASGTSIVIPAGSTTGTVTLTAVDDALDEPNETIVTDIATVTNGTESGTQQVTATITDDDPEPSVTLSLAGSPFAENGGVATVTATLSAVSAKDVVVSLSYSGTAVNASDYLASGTNILIPAGSLTGTVTLTGVDDAFDEPNETVIVDVSGVSNGVESGTQQVTAVIADDDPAPNVTLSLNGSPMAEHGGAATVTATLDAVSGQDVTVSLAFSGTAAFGSDYTASASSIVIPAGSTTGTVVLSSIDDALHEGPETAVVDINAVANGTESGTQQVTAVIADDDAAPGVTLSLAGSPLAENGGVATVTATLDAVSGQDVTVDLAYSGTATNGTDYTASATSIVIPAGSTSGSATLTGVDDALDETDETIVVDIASVTNGIETGTQQQTATITDDDAPPTVALSLAGSPLAENGGVATVTATLSAPSGRDVTVNLAYSGTAVNGTDYAASASSIAIPAGATTGSVTLTGQDDSTYEGDETVIVDVASVVNATESGIQQQTATISDDDPAPSSGGGGGAFDWLSLGVLLVPVWLRRRRLA